MVTELRIYFEGDTRLRPGFHSFLKEIVEAARQKRCRLELVATDGTPVEDFRIALRSHPDAWNVLLLDSEGSLSSCDRRKKFDREDDDRVFWMVELMESWFLADIPTLSAFYGNRFQEGALKGNPKVEEIPKADVRKRLNKASGDTYHKTNHAPKLLERIDPALVRKAAPNCERMFRTILAML